MFKSLPSTQLMICIGSVGIHGLFIPLWLPNTVDDLPSTYEQTDFRALAYNSMMCGYLQLKTFAPSILEIIMGKFGKASETVRDFEFINLTLDRSQKQDFDAWLKANGKNLIDLAQKTGEAGYKFSSTPDFDNACFIATLTGTKAASENVNKGLTARAETFWEALALVLYKHHVLCKASTWQGEETRRNWG